MPQNPRRLSYNPQARALFRLGLGATEAGQHRLAAGYLTQAVELRPCAKYWANLAVALERVAVELETDPAARRDLLEQAVVASLQALRIRSQFVAAASNLVLVLERLGRFQEALFYASLVTAWAPRSVAAAQARAGLLARQESWIEAAHWYGRARHLKPAGSATHNEVACLTNCARDTEALYLLHEELLSKPYEVLTWINLGCVWRRLGRNQAALECYERALELDPGAASAAWGRSLCLLALGRMTEGWEAYEWGLTTGDRKPPRSFPQPRWSGEPLRGKTLLVWMEQGLGDHILWSGMLMDLLRLGARLVVECEHRLVTLFQRSFPEAEFVPQTDPPHERTGWRFVPPPGAVPQLTASATMPGIDYQVPAGSLPRLLRPNLASFGRVRCHLTPGSASADIWEERLAQLGPGRNVGICWRSLRYTGVRSIDCMRLSQWGPILSIPGIHWINLQPGWRQEELEEVGSRFDARLHTWSDLDLKDHQDELAALISRLDLVVSAFTVTAQMAGALGVPCWVLSHQGNRSWWTLGTNYCPWHPSLRFFECPALELWNVPIHRLARELRSWLQV